MLNLVVLNLVDLRPVNFNLLLQSMLQDPQNYLIPNTCKLATALSRFNLGDNQDHFSKTLGLDQRPLHAKYSDSAPRKILNKKKRGQQDPYTGVLNSEARSLFLSATNLVN